SHNEALPVLRDPWGVSVYQAQSSVLDADSTTRVDTRLPDPTLRILSAETFTVACTELDRFVSLGGLRLRAGASPWSTALHAGSITSPDQAQSAHHALTQLANGTLPNALQWIDYVCESTG